MPEIKKVFLRGKMNKDLDERLIPDGEYTDAQNIQVSSTNESDAGTVQNIRGTKLLTDLSEASKFGTGAKCIGKVSDEENDKIYWFVKSSIKQGIIEHDTSTDISKPLVIDTAGTALNFPDYEITGVAILDRNIIWTDNNSEPKIIDIDEFVTYSTYINTSNPYEFTTQISNSPITEEDITVIKKKPINAPGIAITKGGTLPEKPLFEDKIVRFAYRWKFKNGQYSVISPFTDTIFDPNLTGGYNLDEGYNDRMLNNILSVTLSIDENTYPSDLNSIDILYKEANNANIYIYKTITNVTASVSLSITKESVYSVLPENQLIRQYDNVPYKAKALDIIGNRLVFGNYVDGIELGNYDPNFNQGSGNTEFVNRTKIPDTAGSNSPNNNTDRRTIKSGRTYQLGIAFEDKYGRQTPVISNESGLIKREFAGNAPKKLNIKMGGSKPTDARITHFKYYIKDSATEYYNFIVERVYDDTANNNHAWVSIPSYEINKIKENDTIALKKAANGGVVSTISKYKVLDISESKPETINTNDSVDGRFFIKVKKDTNLTNETIAQGGISSSALITDGSSNWVSGSEGGIFLGQYSVQDGNATYERTRFYFNDGTIVEVVDTIGYSVANTFEHTNGGYTVNNPCSSSAGNNWKDLNKSGTDSSGTVTAVYVRNFLDGSSYNDYPYEFYICLSNPTTPSNPSSTGPAIFETVPDNNILDIYYEISDSYPIADFNIVKNLDWYNAFDFSDGVESNRIKDDFNEVFIGTQIKASTTIDSPFKQKTNKSGLIYSGLYNSRNGVNDLNQFNTGEKITKDLNPEYGSIQKLHARDTDLIAFCEDKVLRILANKDALFNADGNVNLVSTNNVLGQAIPYSGEFGISKDPESFATNGNRIYFADKSRNSVLRLSRDGLTIISSKGMKTYFRDKINSQELKIVGAYDQFADQYIISFDHATAAEAESVSFKEDVDGWVSRLTYVIKPALSINGKFYSFNNGNLYEHYHPSASTNTFHGEAFKSSGVQLIFNQEASAIKNFKTISYEGTQAKTSSKQGWSVGSIITDQQEGQIIEFKEKEGKWFANISGVTKDVGIEGTPDIDTQEFAIQGLGNLLSLDSSIIDGATVLDCKDFNFTMTSGAEGDASISVASVSIGTINSVTPSTLQAGDVEYTANIAIPSQYGNTASTIDCTFELNTDTTTTIAPCDCSDFGFSVSDGLEGDPVVATVTSGTIQTNSISPGVYQAGTTTYSATIIVPSGCSNENATITCTDTATSAAAASSYDCTTVDDWATIEYHPFTGAITVSPVRSSTTIHSYSPTTHAPNSGDISVDYTFSDSGTAWGNTNTQVTCTGANALTVNTNITYTANITGPTNGSTGTDISLTAKLLASNAYYSNIDVTTLLSNAFTWSGSATANGQTSNPLTFNESVAGSNYEYTVSIDASALNNAGGPYTDTHSVNWSEAGVTLTKQSADIYQTANSYTLTATPTLTSGAQFEFQKSVDLKQTWTVIQALSSDNTINVTEECGNAGSGTYNVYYRVRMTGTNTVTNTSVNIFDNNNILIPWLDRPAIDLYYFNYGSQNMEGFDCTQDLTGLSTTTYYGNSNLGVGTTTKLYSDCTSSTQPGISGIFLYVSGNTKIYAYFNNGNIVSQPNSQYGWVNCASLTLTYIEGANTITFSGTTIEKCAGIDSVQITANVEGIEYDEVSWTPTGSTSLSTTASSGTPQSITYTCTLKNNGNFVTSASGTINFINCSTLVAARKCASTTQPLRYLRVDGILNMSTAGDVVEFTAINNSTLPEGDGCYQLIEKTGVTESPQATVSVTDVTGFSDCNACNCDPTDTSEFNSISVSDPVKYIYADGVTSGSTTYNTVTLTASITNEVCLSSSNYKWYAGTSTDQATHELIKNTSSNNTTITYEELTNAGLSITPNSTLVYYHCKLNYTIGAGSGQIATSNNTGAMTWLNLPEFTLSYLNSGTASNPDDSICSSSSGSALYPVFGNEGQDPGQDNLLLATKFYSNAERTQVPANGTWKSNYSGNATNIYTYLLNGEPQTPTGAVSGTNWRACVANFSLTSNRGDSGYTLCNNLTANLFANYDPNVLTLNTSTYEWRVNNVVQTGSNGQANFTASNLGGTGLVTYGVTVEDTNGTPYTDTFDINWEACSVKVRARKCGNTTGYVVVIINGTSTIANGVFNLTAGVNQSLPEGNGCYTILETTTESANAEVTAVGPNGDSSQPYADCNVSACGGPPPGEYWLLTRCSDGAYFRTQQSADSLSSYYVNLMLKYIFEHYRVTGRTDDTSIAVISDPLVVAEGSSCPIYYGLQKCTDLSTNHRTFNTVIEQDAIAPLTIGDRVLDVISSTYYTVFSNNATGGFPASVIGVGTQGCPELTEYYYQIQDCDTGTNYRTQRTVDAVLFTVGAIVRNTTASKHFTVISNTAEFDDFPEYSEQLTFAINTTCPIGDYSCDTHSSLITSSYDSSNGAITLSGSTSTIEIISFSPTTATAGQGDVTVTYSFRDTNVNYNNYNTIISGCTITVDTGTTVIYRATFIDCAGSGAVVHVRSINEINTQQVISDGTKCYRFLNNNGDTSNEADISTYTVYFEPDLDYIGNCTVCENTVNPTTTTTTTTTLAPCIAVDIYRTRFNPATNQDAMNILCGGGFATTQYFNASSVGAATIYYSDFTCTTYRSTPEYISDANNTSQYYYWNGSSLTLIGNTGPCQ